jgi:hypothetical protein
MRDHEDDGCEVFDPNLVDGVPMDLGIKAIFEVLPPRIVLYIIFEVTLIKMFKMSNIPDIYNSFMTLSYCKSGLLEADLKQICKENWDLVKSLFKSHLFLFKMRPFR